MPHAIVIPVDLNQPIRQQHLNKNDLDAYRQVVGGPLELVNLDRPEAGMYFHGEGKLDGLPVNARATVLLWVHNRAFRGQDMIVGPALLVGPPDANGNDLDCPEDLVDLLFHSSRYLAQMHVKGDMLWHGDNQVFEQWFDAYVHAVRLTQRWKILDEVRVIPQLNDALRESWYQLGLSDPWISQAGDPPFTRGSFVGCYSVEELEQRLRFTNWSLGTAFYYRDLCFIQQVDGGDEWLTIRHGIAFESMTLMPFIEQGEFAPLVRRLLAASKEQCEMLTY
ncbi:DUF3846 domain-containing protein [Amycolatopsis japonica]|uniref:DUF3846 domain-containing protein n=1 Tax=Amycolatopsis japonica TaxID=208439 RepID=UPI0034056798